MHPHPAVTNRGSDSCQSASPPTSQRVRRARVLGVFVATSSVALAGTFQISWSGDPQSHGLVPKTDLGAPCAYPGAATSALAGTFPGSGGCFLIFNAPGAATIQSMSVTGQYSKATASPNLCAHSFSDIGSPSPLNLCDAGAFSQLIPVANGRWTEIGLYNKTTTPIALATSNANNVNFASGTITLDDPTPPALSLSGSVPAFVGGDALGFQFAASDPESRAGSVAWSLDGAGGGALVGRRLRRCLRVRHRLDRSFTASGLAGLPTARTPSPWPRRAPAARAFSSAYSRPITPRPTWRAV